MAYGRGDNELVDVFPTGSDDTMHVFIHGGYWQRLSRRDASFPAVGFNESGYQFAAPGYTLTPYLALEGIVDQLRRAIGFMAGYGRPKQSPPRSMIVSGSSAGAHLAAMVALADWESAGFDRSPVSGLALLSGIYDLRPLVDTYINDKVGMDLESAWALSPMNLMASSTIKALPLVVVVGEIETASFKQQAEEFSDLATAGGHGVTTIEVADRNHFDLVFDLADRRTVLGAAVMSLERAAGWT